MGISGTWLKTVENAGQFVFRCEANNSVQGNGKSRDIFLSVNGEMIIFTAVNYNYLLYSCCKLTELVMKIIVLSKQDN